MGRTNKAKGRLPSFVPLFRETLEAPAYRAMSHGARSLYTALKARYNSSTHNNGRIFLSQRNASKEIGSHHNEIARWFRELQHFGFIVMTSPSSLGVAGMGKAPRWRLTEVDYMKDLATKDFLRWAGQPFQNQKTKSRAGKSARRVRGKAHAVVLESLHATRSEDATNGAHDGMISVQETPHNSILPLPHTLDSLDIPDFLRRRSPVVRRDDGRG